MGLTPTLLIQPQTTVVQTSATSVTVVTVAEQGPAGPAGPAGGSVAVQGYVATVTVSAYPAVAAIAGGIALGDSAQAALAGAIVGIATAGTAAGSSCPVQYAGELTYNGWTWVMGKPIFVGAGGVLTQTPPATGFLQSVGTPTSATSLFINLQPAILIA